MDSGCLVSGSAKVKELFTKFVQLLHMNLCSSFCSDSFGPFLSTSKLPKLGYGHITFDS